MSANVHRVSVSGVPSDRNTYARSSDEDLAERTETILFRCPTPLRVG